MTKDQISIDDVYKTKSDFLKADDLKGKKVSLVIEDFEQVKFSKDGEDDEFKLALKFYNKEKMLVLNVTNARTIAQGLGSKHPMDWIDREIKIYPTTTQFGGNLVDCIRVEVPVPDAGDDDNIPF